MTRRDCCRGEMRVADRTFTTFGSRGGVVFVLSGAWQLGDKLLTADQGRELGENPHPAFAGIARQVIIQRNQLAAGH